MLRHLAAADAAEAGSCLSNVEGHCESSAAEHISIYTVPHGASIVTLRALFLHNDSHYFPFHRYGKACEAGTKTERMLCDSGPGRSRQKRG